MMLGPMLPLRRGMTACTTRCACARRERLRVFRTSEKRCSRCSKKTAGHNQNVSYFVDCCFKHAQTDRNKPFKVPSVHGEDMSMALHRWLNLDHREHTHGVIQTRTVDTEAWPHAGQKCDLGPEWQQFIKNDAFEMSNGDFVGQFVDSDPSS